MSAPSPLLQRAWDHLRAERFDAAIREATPHLPAAAPSLRREANKLCGLARFKGDDPEGALPHMEAAAEGSEQTEDWFNVVTTAALAGRVELAWQAFETAAECQERSGHTQQPPLPMMRYYFACALRDRGEFALAFEQIDALRETYGRLVTTDDTFVHMRGVPFLGQTLRLAEDVLRGLGNRVDGLAWLEQFAGPLDEEGQAMIDRMRSASSGAR